MENSYKTVKKPVNKDTMIIAIVIFVILALTIGIVCYYFWGMNSEVFVAYNGGDINRGEYEAIYRYWAPFLIYSGYSAESIPQTIVDQILLNEVIYNEAKAQGYELKEDAKKDIDSQFANADSIAALRSQSINPDILKKFFYENAVVSDFLNDMEENVTTEQVKAAIIKAEGENADLNLYKTSHILFEFKSDMTADQKAELLKTANNILTKVKKGEDFATLAKEYSDDSGTASNDGKFDMVNNESVVKAYREAVLKLKAGQVYSTVVETEYGYHIIKLNSIEKDGRLTNDNDIATFIDNYIEEKVEAALDRNSEAYKKQFEGVLALAKKLNAQIGIVDTSED